MWDCDYNGISSGQWFFGGGIIGLAIVILIIIVLTILIFKFIKPNQSNHLKNIDKNDSLKILEIRFAKGDIDELEFQKKKDILGK
jgi:putative membrane protein